MDRFLATEQELLDPPQPFKDTSGTIHIPISQAWTLIAERGSAGAAESRRQARRELANHVTEAAAAAGERSAVGEESVASRKNVDTVRCWWRRQRSRSLSRRRPSGQSIAAARSQVSPADLSNVGIDQRLDQQMPLDLQFKDETGKTVQLGDYFQHGRPVILNLVYYTCPMLCGEELVGEASALSSAAVHPGQGVRGGFGELQSGRDAAGGGGEEEDLHRPHERASGAQDQRRRLALPDRRSSRRSNNWPTRSASTTGAIRKTGQFIHAAAIMIVTPHGQDCSVLLRGGVFAQGHSPRSDRGVARQDWNPRGPGGAVLLSLRSKHRTIRCCNHQHHAGGRSSHLVDSRRLSHCDVSSRIS